MPEICKDCLGFLISVNNRHFSCESCHVLMHQKEIVPPQTSRNIEMVIGYCIRRGSRTMMEAVSYGIGHVARERRVNRQTIIASCTRDIGLTGSEALVKFAEKVEALLLGHSQKDLTY